MEGTEVGSSNSFENCSAAKAAIVRCDYFPPMRPKLEDMTDEVECDPLQELSYSEYQKVIAHKVLIADTPL